MKLPFITVQPSSGIPLSVIYDDRGEILINACTVASVRVIDDEIRLFYNPPHYQNGIIISASGAEMPFGTGYIIVPVGYGVRAETGEEKPILRAVPLQ